MDEDLTAELIEPVLRGRFGHPLRYFESIGSTNEEAMSWAQQGAPEGAVVGADHQTAGRGRWGRAWSSEPGRLLQTSTVLRPRLAVSDAGVITTAVGVACARAIEEVTAREVGLKWPNDVTIDGKKLAGILVESRVDDSGTIDFAIAGVGINVNWAVEEMPEEFRARATSVLAETGYPADRLLLLITFLAAFEDVYSRVTKPGGRDEVLAEAAMRSDVLGGRVTVRFLDGSTIEGTAESLDRSGGLELETAAGRKTVHVGEIEQLRPV